MLTIRIPYQYNDSYSGITIDREEYLLRFTYNVLFDYWEMGVYDTNREPIVSGIKLVPNFPVNHYCRYSNTPKGVFSLISYINKDTIGKKDLMDGSAVLVYIPYDELPEEVRVYEE